MTSLRQNTALIFGLGLYMASRRLSALAMEGVGITPELNMLAGACFPVSLAVLIIANRAKGWSPSGKAILVFGLIGTASVILMHTGVESAVIAGRLISGISYAMLTIGFGLAVCAASKKDEAIATLSFSMLVCVASILIVQALPFQSSSLAFLCLAPAAVGIFLTKNFPIGNIEGTTKASPQKPLDKKDTIVMLAAIAFGYALCSMLNGVSGDYFLLSSSTMLLSVLLSAVVILAYLFFLMRKGEAKLNAFGIWSFVFIALVVCLIGFSSSLPINTTLAHGIAFSGLTLFYFASWLICPVIIQRSQLPFIPAFGTISIICYGHHWRMIGSALNNLNETIFSTSFIGVLTVAFLAVATVILAEKWMSRRKTEKTARVVIDEEHVARLAKLHSLSEREREVCKLILEGFSASKIAEKLFVSESTVRFHLKNIYRKCQVKSKQELLDSFLKDNQYQVHN